MLRLQGVGGTGEHSSTKFKGYVFILPSRASVSRVQRWTRLFETMSGTIYRFAVRFLLDNELSHYVYKAYMKRIDVLS